MATAKKVDVPPPADPVVVSVQLTQNEVNTLLAILGRVAGSPRDSYRMYVDSIYHALFPMRTSSNAPDQLGGDQVFLPWGDESDR